MAEEEKSPDSPGPGEELKRVRFEVGALPIPLKKTGAAIDRLLSVPIDAAANWVEEKFKSNIDEHVDRVVKSRGKRSKPSKVGKEELSIEKMQSRRSWAAEAGQVDEEDRVLSAAWRAALDRILDQQGEEDDLLRALAGVQRGNLRGFLSRYGWQGRWLLILHRFGDRWNVDASELANARLITRFFNVRVLTLLFIAALFLYPIANFLQYIFVYQPVNVPAWISRRWAAAEDLGLLPWAIGFAVVVVYLASRIFVPTELGRDLLRRYRIYLDEERRDRLGPDWQQSGDFGEPLPRRRKRSSPSQ
jgi:hypothetical protein